MCFNVVPGGPGPLPPSRVLLVWTPPNESRPPEIAEIARLAGSERSLAIPLASIPPPRTSIDLGQAWGYIVVQPLDSAAAPDLKGSSGAATMMLVHAIDAPNMAPLFKDKYPNGMAQGTAPYTMKKDGRFDDLVVAPPGSVFDLYVCAAGMPCNVELPNPH